MTHNHMEKMGVPTRLRETGNEDILNMHSSDDPLPAIYQLYQSSDDPLPAV